MSHPISDGSLRSKSVASVVKTPPKEAEYPEPSGGEFWARELTTIEESAGKSVRASINLVEAVPSGRQDVLGDYAL